MQLVCLVINHNEKNINDFEVLNSNFIGPSIFIGELANAFELRGYGTIIGISSIAGVRGRGKNYIYGSAKAGFTSYLSGLRNRLINQMFTFSVSYQDTLIQNDKRHEYTKISFNFSRQNFKENF